ncbi:MAG: hypothetical protein E8D40_04865 [Nitrospira sp.]|nr:MAG: hypothetical protein E8D40_04865 [Nitrospira sp.]
MPYSLRAAQGLPTSDPPKIVTAVTAAVPVKDADRRAQVIGKLEQIASIKPDEVAKSAKTIFHQMVVGRNVIQGEHVIVTIGAHDEKAPKKFLEKWQAWVVIMGSILAGVLALFALQKIGQIQAAKEQLKTALEYEKADKDELKKKYERLDTDHRNQHEIDLMKHSSRRLISHQLLVLEDAFNSHTINDPAPVLEILGTNATGPIHQGRDLIRKVLKPENGQGKPGTVRILLLDPTCDAMRDRMEKEEDKVGRILAEMNASLYLLADIRDRVGASAFANLELRMHKEPPDRSLLMLDVGASMDPPINKGVIVENMYPHDPKIPGNEPGIAGESNIYKPIRGQSEQRYHENRVRFGKLWHDAKPMSLPNGAFHFPVELLLRGKPLTR